MVLRGEYTWKETSGSVQVSVGLRGVSTKSVDIFSSPSYVKISFAPYLIELDLLHDVNDSGAVARIKNGELTLSLPKAVAGKWGRLCVENMSKTELIARRSEARRKKEEAEISLSEERRVRKREEERQALRTQMALDAAERNALEDRKAAEKELAERRVYEALRAVEEKEEKRKEEQRKARAKESDEERERRQLVEGFDIDLDNDDDDDEEPPLLAPSATAAKKPDPPSEETLPSPPKPPISTQASVRASSKIEVGHTPRVFPTPMRESKLSDEHEWIKRNRAHLHKNAILKNVKGGGIEETDPTWLKSRGDELFKGGDPKAAVEAYTAALEVDPQAQSCLANRAACYLKLGAFRECIDDCRAALDQGGHQAKILARRAAAKCGLGEFAAGVEDFEAAAEKADSESTRTALLKDADSASRLRDASRFKTAGDASLSAGDADAAVVSYSQALDAEPSFVSALANRAAARLGSGDLQGAVDDSTAALKIFERDDLSTTLGVSGPL